MFYLKLTAICSYLPSIPDLPSVAGLVVQQGDRVEEGQLIARYVDDAALEASEVEIAAAKARIPALEKRIGLERSAHQAKLNRIRERIRGAQGKLERVRYLVEAGAEPGVRLVEAEDASRRAQGAEREALTAWTSRVNDLQERIRGARLSIKRAEAVRSGELEEQWVKAPLAGLVADVRLTEVTVKGVTLEVMILQQETPLTAGVQERNP